ncbi:MAG: heme-copper oxidase subunit III [Acidobacteriota bacterium]|jgi:heme/copper-type cytochrome/quinol oxidase subunit 3
MSSALTEKNKLAILLFLVSEAVFFVLLIVAYVTYHLRQGNGPTASNSLNIVKTGVFSAFLFASSYTVWRAGLSFQAGNRSWKALAWLAVTIAFGLIFLVGQGLEYSDLIRHHVTISRDLFGTTFFTLTGFHGLHVSVGLIMLTVVLWIAGRSGMRKPKPAAVEVVSYYWHFVDAVWVFIFGVVYLWAFVG